MRAHMNLSQMRRGAGGTRADGVSGLLPRVLLFVLLATGGPGSWGTAADLGDTSNSNVELRAVLLSCPNRDSCSDNDDVLSRVMASEEEQIRESNPQYYSFLERMNEREFPNDVKDCKRKIVITMKVKNAGKIPLDDQYIVVDHVYDPETGGRGRLLTPIVLKLRQEQMVQLYRLRYERAINGDPFEEKWETSKRCSENPSNPSCGITFYDGKPIPFSEGFCCSCNAAKNKKRELSVMARGDRWESVGGSPDDRRNPFDYGQIVNPDLIKLKVNASPPLAEFEGGQDDDMDMTYPIRGFESDAVPNYLIENDRKIVCEHGNFLRQLCDLRDEKARKLAAEEEPNLLEGDGQESAEDEDEEEAEEEGGSEDEFNTQKLLENISGVDLDNPDNSMVADYLDPNIVRALLQAHVVNETSKVDATPAEPTNPSRRDKREEPDWYERRQMEKRRDLGRPARKKMKRGKRLLELSYNRFKEDGGRMRCRNAEAETDNGGRRNSVSGPKGAGNGRQRCRNNNNNEDDSGRGEGNQRLSIPPRFFFFHDSSIIHSDDRSSSVYNNTPASPEPEFQKVDQKYQKLSRKSGSLKRGKNIEDKLRDKALSGMDKIHDRGGMEKLRRQKERFRLKMDEDKRKFEMPDVSEDLGEVEKKSDSSDTEKGTKDSFDIDEFRLKHRKLSPKNLRGMQLKNDNDENRLAEYLLDRSKDRQKYLTESGTDRKVPEDRDRYRGKETAGTETQAFNKKKFGKSELDDETLEAEIFRKGKLKQGEKSERPVKLEETEKAGLREGEKKSLNAMEGRLTGADQGKAMNAEGGKARWNRPNYKNRVVQMNQGNVDFNVEIVRKPINDDTAAFAHSKKGKNHFKSRIHSSGPGFTGHTVPGNNLNQVEGMGMNGQQMMETKNAESQEPRFKGGTYEGVSETNYPREYGMPANSEPESTDPRFLEANKILTEYLESNLNGKMRQKFEQPYAQPGNQFYIPVADFNKGFAQTMGQKEEPKAVADMDERNLYKMAANGFDSKDLFYTRGKSDDTLNAPKQRIQLRMKRETESGSQVPAEGSTGTGTTQGWAGPSNDFRKLSDVVRMNLKSAATFESDVKSSSQDLEKDKERLLRSYAVAPDYVIDEVKRRLSKREKEIGGKLSEGSQLDHTLRVTPLSKPTIEKLLKEGQANSHNFLLKSYVKALQSLIHRVMKRVASKRDVDGMKSPDGSQVDDTRKVGSRTEPTNVPASQTEDTLKKKRSLIRPYVDALHLIMDKVLTSLKGKRSVQGGKASATDPEHSLRMGSHMKRQLPRTKSTETSTDAQPAAQESTPEDLLRSYTDTLVDIVGKVMETVKGKRQVRDPTMNATYTESGSLEESERAIQSYTNALVDIVEKVMRKLQGKQHDPAPVQTGNATNPDSLNKKVPHAESMHKKTVHTEGLRKKGLQVHDLVKEEADKAKAEGKVLRKRQAVNNVPVSPQGTETTTQPMLPPSDQTNLPPVETTPVVQIVPSSDMPQTVNAVVRPEQVGPEPVPAPTQISVQPVEPENIRVEEPHKKNMLKVGVPMKVIHMGHGESNHGHSQRIDNTEDAEMLAKAILDAQNRFAESSTVREPERSTTMGPDEDQRRKESIEGGTTDDGAYRTVSSTVSATTVTEPVPDRAGSSEKANAKASHMDDETRLRVAEAPPEELTGQKRYKTLEFRQEGGQETAHCMRYGDMWYSMYRIEEPTIAQVVGIQLFEKRPLYDGTTEWRDLTNGKMTRVGTFLPIAEDEIPSISIKYEGRQIGNVKNSIDTENYLLLVPSHLSDPDKANYYPQLDGGSKEYLVVESKDVSSGADCNMIGTSFEAFAQQSDRCLRPRGSCLKRQPVDLWREDMEAKIRGKRGKYFVENFGTVASSPVKTYTNITGEFLALEYYGMYSSTIEIELKADSNAIIRKRSVALIPSVYVDGSYPKKVRIILFVLNTGLTSAYFRPRLAECSQDQNSSWCPPRGPLMVIAPQQRHTFMLDLTGSPPPHKMTVTVEVLNEKNKVVAQRKVVIKKGDRCICAFHCECNCIGRSTNLACRKLSPNEYRLAGYVGPYPFRIGVSPKTSGSLCHNLRVIFLTAFYILLFTGILKAIVGVCCRGIGIIGTRAIVGPRCISQYYEPDLSDCCVVFDEFGFPIHPKTRGPVQIVPMWIEMLINFTFFLLYPLKVVWYLISLLIFTIYSKCLSFQDDDAASGSQQPLLSCSPRSTIVNYALTSPGSHEARLEPQCVPYKCDDDPLEEDDTDFVLQEMKRHRKNVTLL